MVGVLGRSDENSSEEDVGSIIRRLSDISSRCHRDRSCYQWSTVNVRHYGEVETETLTPSHLLYGRRLTQLPYCEDRALPASDGSNKANLARRAKIQKILINHFRERWKHEYMTTLREHHCTSGRNQQTRRVGDVVLDPRGHSEVAMETGYNRGTDRWEGRACSCREDLDWFWGWSTEN